MQWPTPMKLKPLQSFLGFCGYYCIFIANYSAIDRPLTKLTKVYPPTQKSKIKALDVMKDYLRESESFWKKI